MNKAELRKQYLGKRKSLSPSELVKINQGLLAQIEKLDFSSHSLIHLFLPIEKNNEPNTYAIHEILKEKYPHLKFVISKSVLDQPLMYNFYWDKNVIIKSNKWGIPEPIGGIQVLSQDIDVVFVPLLVADKSGHRVGYGKGYYDVFLSQCNPSTLKIGISCFDIIEQIEDASFLDISLDLVLTPDHIYTIKKGL